MVSLEVGIVHADGTLQEAKKKKEEKKGKRKQEGSNTYKDQGERH